MTEVGILKLSYYLHVAIFILVIIIPLPLMYFNLAIPPYPSIQDISRTLLTIYATFLGFVFAASAFYITLIEMKRQSLVSMKGNTNLSPEFKELLGAFIEGFRTIGTSYLKFSKMVAVTFAILILAAFSFYLMTSYMITSQLFDFLYYLSITSMVIFVIDIVLMVLLMKF